MTTPAEDVVVKIRRPGDGWLDFGRDTETVARAFVAAPWRTFTPGTEFVAVDNWGYGAVIAATDESLVGHSWRDVCLVERALRI